MEKQRKTNTVKGAVAAALISSIILALYLAGYLFMAIKFWEDIGLLMIAVSALPLIGLICISIALIQRVRELKGKELQESQQY